MSYYVYILLDPRIFPEKPFYVGVSNGDRKRGGSRVLEHYNEKYLDPRSSSYRNHAKSNLITKLNKMGYEPCYRIVHECETSEEVFEKEKELIAGYGRVDNGSGILFNKTDGGESTQGIVFTDEMRLKASKVKRKYPEDLIRFCLDHRFKKFMTAKQISKLPEVSKYGVNYQQVQSWIQGTSYKEIAAEYPTIKESDGNLCLQVHLDRLAGKTGKEIKSNYKLSTGTYTRICKFEFKWDKFKDYVEEIVAIGGQL